MSILTGAPTVEFCEKAGQGLIARPFYALSNLPYLFVSYLIIKKGKGTLAKLFAITTGVIGTLSLIYDIRPVRLTQLTDLMGMYIFAGLLLTLTLSRLLSKPLKVILFFVAPLVGFGYLSTILLGGQSGNIIFGTYIFVHILGELFMKLKGRSQSYALWVKAFAVFMVGFASWLLDVTKTFCADFGLLNGRVVFHYAGAAAAYLLYLFYASQEDDFKLE